jgi:hypothetical protein
MKKWDRVRFHANEDDWRPVIWPPIGPYWCSGSGDNYAVIVAYFPTGSTDEDIKKYWPEASNIDRMQENVDISFSDRFAKPDWWKE